MAGSNGSKDRSNGVKQRLLKNVASKLEGYLNFYDQVSQDAEEGWPTWSQSIRMKALMDNKRILVADDTGVNGKTFTAVGSKLALDKYEGEKHSTLVIAPNSGLLNAWSPSEINRYAGIMNMPKQKVVTVDKYAHLENVTNETDFTVLNWEKLSVREDDMRWNNLDRALGILDPKITVLDECHSAKGTNSLRSKTMQRITQRINGDRLMLLSATPIPNKYRDLGMIFHMLDPEKYSNPSMFSHTPPEVMKELLDRQVWFRLTREDLKEEIGLPDFYEREIPVNLTDEEAEIYFKGWADCVTLGQGLTELRKTLYNPTLSKYGAGFKGKSSKLEAIANLTDELVTQGHKVMIKTNLVNFGIVEDIAETMSCDKHVLVATGNNCMEYKNGKLETKFSKDDKKTLYWQFKHNPKKPILIASSVAEESLDLTTGEIPVAVVPYEPEITPREFNQVTGRVYRRGQKAPVTHYTFVAQSEKLNQMMLGYLQNLAEEHGIKVPKKFRPRTIDADMLGMRKAKDNIVNKVYGGEKITRREESVYNASEVDRAVTHLEGLVKPSTFKDMQPFELSSLVQTRWRNLGEEQFESLVRSKGWKKWRNLYEDGWKGSASHATNIVLGRLVDRVEEEIGYEPVVVSVGDGRAYFSRASGRASIGVDIDKKWLEQGKRDCDKKKITYEFVHASATDTTLPDNLADVVVNAYSIFYMGQDEERSEVEQAIIESNRVLKENGRLMLALPNSMEGKVIDRWNEHMPEYGFSPRGYLSPKQTKCNNMKNGVHILDYEKIGEVREPLGLDLSFYMNMEVFVG